MKKTSIEAHESIKPVKPTHHKIILAVLQQGKAMTAEEISVQCRLNYMQVIRRLSEMTNYVECTPLTAANQSGRAARKWRLKDTEPTLF